jgi:beta-lactam-binding protein with PASTA domain
MSSRLAGAIRSRRAQKIYLAGLILVLLFFLANDFLLPWYVNQGGIIEVPAVGGYTFERAERILDSAGLEARKGDVRLDREHPAGTVITQNPLPGHKVKRGRRVYLTVSGGELTATVPNVRGRTLRDARFALEREGLKIGEPDYQPSDEFPTNTVMDQTIAAGSKVRRDTEVGVVISQGPASDQVSVPDLNGKNLAEAQRIILASRLRVGNISYLPSAELLPNTVMEQYPRAGERVGSGQAIDLFVVQGGERKKDFLEN